MDIRSGSVLAGPDGRTITIEKLIGRGGLGQVFSGVMDDSRVVAVKTVLTAVLNDDELLSLQNEAKHAAGIDHPNVVRVLHVSDGHASAEPPYIVMEFIDGGTLRSMIDAHRAAKTQISPQDLRALYIQIARGMAAVNERVVHRDLKPENVLYENDSGLLKIADFGLAKLADASTRPRHSKAGAQGHISLPRPLTSAPTRS
jgi:eukaryotic-like serine/threonine-protein kinase